MGQRKIAIAAVVKNCRGISLAYGC